ncbi:MAG: YdcF family protein [Verrucomicrobiota bacterium]
MRAKVIKRTIWGLLIVLLLVAALAVLFPQPFLCVDSGPVTADVIVVLGGGSRERPERAAELFQEHAAPRIIVSGFGDAGINRRLLLGVGVPASVIELEDQSKTTRENARFTIKMLRERGVKRVILVTSWYHSRRALRCFEHYGPDIQFFSRPSYYAVARSDWRQRGVVRKLYWEYPKLAGYWIYYGVCPF